MEKANLSAINLFATSLAVEAGEMLMKFFQSGSYDIVEKEGVDFTTEADQKTDEFIISHLRAKFPSYMILTEESAVGTDFSSFADADYCWVVDPLDGTGNFSRGDTNFSVSIALVKKGIPVLGVVYLPAEKKLYMAQAEEEGAWLNGKRIKVSQTSQLNQMVVACDWAWDLEARKTIAKYVARIALKVRQIKCMGSACADLCKMAEGKIDAYIHTGLKPWDVAAAGLICYKAGACTVTIAGMLWNPFEKTIFVSNNRTTDHILFKIMTSGLQVVGSL